MSGALDEFFVRFTDLAERSVDDTGRPELVQSDRIIHKFMYVCVCSCAGDSRTLAGCLGSFVTQYHRTAASFVSANLYAALYPIFLGSSVYLAARAEAWLRK